MSNEQQTAPQPEQFTPLSDTVHDDTAGIVRRSKRRRRLMLAIGALGVAALIAAAVVVTVLVTRPDKPVPVAPPAAFAVTGSIVVPAEVVSSGQAVGDSCATDDGYGDITSGTQVTVKDAAGTVVAVGQLQAGTVAELYGEGDMPALDGYASKCTFDFIVSGVPGGQQIYSVEVSHRGQLQYQRDQLEQPLALTLGN